MQAAIREQNRIESTGERLSIAQREWKSFSAIAQTIERAGRLLRVLGMEEAAEHCKRAVDAIERRGEYG